MPITNTQDVWYPRSIDVVHINPSILEGVNFYPSILGPDAAVQVVRYAPTFLVQPSISGSFKIPSVLTCNPGVIDASPKPDLFYQWRSDGVDIPGETGITLTTVLAFDAHELTCEVTAVNPLGVAVGVSNGITAERVEPIINEEHVYFGVSGLDQDLQQNMMRDEIAMVSGMWHADRFDTELGVVFAGTGLWVEGRLDNETHMINAITGLGSEQRLYADTPPVAALSGLGAETRQDVEEHEIYTIWQPVYVQDLPILNGDAELGLAHWTNEVGNLTLRSSSPNPVQGTQYFMGGWQEASTIAYQDIVLPASVLTDVDNGNSFLGGYWQCASYARVDHFGLTFECLDAGGVSLGLQTLHALSKHGTRHQVWEPSFADPVAILPLTRTIRLKLNFALYSGNNSDGYVDDIHLTLWKDS